MDNAWIMSVRSYAKQKQIKYNRYNRVMSQEEFEKRFKRAKFWIRFGAVVVGVAMITLAVLKYYYVI